MNKMTLITIALAILVIVSAVQAVQLTALKSKLESNKLTTKATTSVKKNTNNGVSVPKSLNNLPKMVGGC